MILGGVAVLFVIIIVLIVRLERLKGVVAASVPVGRTFDELSSEDQAALKELRAFGSILGDYGWEVYWAPTSPYAREGVVHLQRGSFHSESPGSHGERERVGVDVFTFGEGAPLPLPEGFPLAHWRDLYPVESFDEEDASFTWVVSQSARTFFVFYQHDEVLDSELPAQFEAFLEGDSRQHAAFRRGLAEADQARKETLAALKTIQKAFLDAGLYEGELDGLNGWRTKKALQRFLRQEGDYSGKIDGVLGNRTLEALNAFRVRSGLEKGDAMDPDLILAQAIVERLTASSNGDEEAKDSTTEG